jgi:hypothetical protein
MPDSRERAGERACHLLLNALHRAGANATLARDLAHAFAGAQLRLDALFDGGIDFRPTELLALCDRALKFKLGKGTSDLKHQLAGRRGGVDRLLVEVCPYASRGNPALSSRRSTRLSTTT